VTLLVKAAMIQLHVPNATVYLIEHLALTIIATAIFNFIQLIYNKLVEVYMIIEQSFCYFI